MFAERTFEKRYKLNLGNYSLVAPAEAPILSNEMRKILPYFLIGASCLTAQGVFTEPKGFNTVTCLNNSDTIVGVPFRAPGSQYAPLASAPVIAGGLATLTLTATTLTDGALGLSNGYPTHYVKFNDGTAKEGSFYTITANTSNSVTIDLNGDSLTGTTTGNSLIIAKYWTLDTLFPPADATTSWTESPAGSGNWVQDGHAVVKSNGSLAFQRRTEILTPDISSTGINLAPSSKYYIDAGIWKKAGAGSTNYGAVALYPENYFIFRHPASVSRSTVFRSVGDVETASFSIPLSTLTTGSQDTFVALPRPVPVSLMQLNLWQSNAFLKSDGTLAFQRRDELLVFDNTSPALNKAASAKYYHNGTNWLKAGDGSVIHDTDIVPAGSGFLIRKYKTATGSTSFWKNIPAY